MTVNCENTGTPPTLKQRTSTSSLVADGNHFCAWHQTGPLLTAVTCTTPPLVARFGNRTITWPGAPGRNGRASAQARCLPDGLGRAFLPLPACRRKRSPTCQEPLPGLFPLRSTPVLRQPRRRRLRLPASRQLNASCHPVPPAAIFQSRRMEEAMAL